MKISGAMRANEGVICREMQADQQAEAGIRMTPGQLEQAREGEGGVFITAKHDPSSLVMFCCGDAVPVVTSDAREKGRASYTYCPVWQAARDRYLAHKAGLYDEPEPEAVSMGVEPYATHLADDPIEAGRRGLKDLLG
jgi:hypothetical protein